MDGERLEFHDVGLTDGGKCHHRSNQSSFCRDSFNARASNLNGSQIMSHFLGRSVEEYGIEHLHDHCSGGGKISSGAGETETGGLVCCCSS